MHSETQNPTPQEAPKADTSRFGSVIKKAREAAKLSYTDLADKLNLSAQTVEWLEREQFDKLPAATFVRGYIRAIATHLSLDAEQLLSAYKQKGFDSDPLLVSTSNRIKSPSFIINFALIFRVIGSLVLVAALAALAWYGFAYFKANRAQANTDEISLSTQNSSAERLNINDTNRLTLSIDAGNQLPLQSLDSVAPTLPELPAKPSLEDSASEAPAAEAKPEAKVEEQPAAPVPENLLTLSATENAWVSVIDGNNKVLVQGTIGSKDGTRSFVALPPVRLHLGNARNLTLTYRGKAVDLVQFISKNNVAQLSLK